MATNDALKAVFLFGPVAGMLLLGSWLTLRSGAVGLAEGRGLRTMAENLSHAALLIVAFLIAFAAIQPWVGYRVALGWVE